MDLSETGPLLAAGAYVAALLVVRRRGARWPLWRAVAFVAGAAAMAGALSPPVLRLDDTDVPVHALQHLLLMMVGPALCCLARPAVLAVHALGSRRRPVVRALAHRTVRLCTGVPAWLAYYLLMALAFWPPLYRIETSDDTVHALVHLGLVVSGLCYWQTVVEPARAGRRLPTVRALAWLLAGMPLEAAVGVALLVTPRPLPGTPLAGTHVGGQLFLMGSMLLTGVALAGVLWRHARAEERVALRTDMAAAARRVSVPAVPGGPVPGAGG